MGPASRRPGRGARLLNVIDPGCGYADSGGLDIAYAVYGDGDRAVILVGSTVVDLTIGSGLEYEPRVIEDDLKGFDRTFSLFTAA